MTEQELDPDDDKFIPKNRTVSDTEIDITPMIDVTFQLLIFFMVTSTMQGTPDLEIPKSVSGGSIETAKVMNVMIMAPPAPDVDPQMDIEGEIVSLEDLRIRVSDQASARPNGIDVMIMADKSVRNGFTGELESLLSEIPGVTYHFAVQDRR